MSISRRDWLTVGGLLGGLAISTRAFAASEEKTNRHVVLLGDSIFDNKVYVGSKPAVIDQVRSTLGDNWQATLLAVDGDVTDDVAIQMKNLPVSASHLVISVGGNDALQNQGILIAQDRNATTTYYKLSEVQRKFEERYKRMIAAVLKQKKPTAVCTIYDPNFPDPQQNQIASAALSAFNDRIMRVAFTHGLPVIDLRLMFSSKDDYANPIEPGPQGGAKIAEQIKQIVTKHDFSKKQSVIYPAAK